MKMVKLIFLLVLIFAVSLQSQVFNTSQTLKSGNWSLGLDATLNFTFPINKQVHLYSGFDFDLNFIDKDDNQGTAEDESGTDTVLPVWLFVGTEIGIRQNMTLLLEVELAINDDAYSIFGGGINFYF